MTDEVICNFCNEKNYFDPEDRSDKGLFQCYHCYKITAIFFDRNIIPSLELLDVRKYHEKIHKFIPIDDELNMINVENSFEHDVLEVILGSRDVGTGFGGFYEPMKAVILATKTEFIGCIVWFRAIRARLSFILIRQEYQRQGYGERFLKAWVEKIADAIDEKYQVESPNKKSGSLLFKLGHLKLENNKIIEEKCIIFPSPGWAPYMMFED